MAKVFFKPLKDHCTASEISEAAGEVLNALLTSEQPELAAQIPLKLHFGEKGNRTYLRQECYDAVIDLLEKRGCECFYTETGVLYGGERFNGEKHAALALAHGFDRLPVRIADGAKGEDSVLLPVPRGRHFRNAAIARLLAESPQNVVLSHFKGHMLAGFGGAIKQLSMGFAAKGGKMAMHLGVKPRIRRWLCRGCGLCVTRCNAGAISKCGKAFHIDRSKCIGCGACFSICPHHAVSILSFGGLWNALFKGKFFREKLVEYAFASHNGKRNIYINFAVNITPGCDCEPRNMKPAIPDIGIFASLDPVAVDTACYEEAARLGKRFRGSEQLEYAEKIGLGSRKYELIRK